MTSALVKGALHKAPEQRTSKNGNPFTMATVRVRNGNETEFWRIFAFSDQARGELDRLGDGDVVAIQGPFEAKIYDAERGPRVSLSITADHVLALRQPTKERTKKLNERTVAPSGASLNDALTF
jgi:single-stranded DNA-binding protein